MVPETNTTTFEDTIFVVPISSVPFPHNLLKLPKNTSIFISTASLMTFRMKLKIVVCTPKAFVELRSLTKRE